MIAQIRGDDSLPSSQIALHLGPIATSSEKPMQDNHRRTVPQFSDGEIERRHGEIGPANFRAKLSPNIKSMPMSPTTSSRKLTRMILAIRNIGIS